MEISIEALKKRYQYEHPRDVIGKGGFADVYKAYDTEDQMWVALKFYKGDWSSKYNVNNEIRRIKKYRHANLIEHIEAYEVISGHDIHGEPIRYQVGILEFANAGTLTEFIRNKPPQQVLGVLIEDIMEGLRYLHSKNIVHRDLKPHNILLLSDGERLTAKIADFGIARLLDGSDATSSHVIGTIEYMSPEHFAPNVYGLNGKLAINADLWALGVMIYEMYTGKVPFGRRSSGNTQQEIIAGILNGSLPEEDVSTIPQPYQDIVRRCLVRNANERAQTIDELRLKEVKQTNAAQAKVLKEHEKEAAQRATEQEAVRQDREVEAATVSNPKKKILPVTPTTESPPQPPTEEAAPIAETLLPGEASPDMLAKNLTETVTMKSGAATQPLKPASTADEGATLTMKADAAVKAPKPDKAPVPEKPMPKADSTDESTLTVKHTIKTGPSQSGIEAKTENIQPFTKSITNNRVAIAAVGTALAIGGFWMYFLLTDRERKPTPVNPVAVVPAPVRKAATPPDTLSKTVPASPALETPPAASEPKRAEKEVAPERPTIPKGYEGLTVKKRANRYGYVDASGKWIIPARFDKADNFRKGKARVVLNGRSMTINPQGKCIQGCEDNPPADLAEATRKAPVESSRKEKILRLEERNNRFGFVDEEGNEVIKCKYQNAKSFSEGLAAVNANGSWGYINTSGVLVIPYQYEIAQKFTNGRALVVLDGERFYINPGGNRIGDKY